MSGEAGIPDEGPGGAFESGPGEGPQEDSPAWGSAYPAEAFGFVREGLDHTVHAIHGPHVGFDERQSRHVDGRQLSLGLRDHAIRRFGLLASVVLARWNITRSDDFGRIVYAMIEQGTMSKTDRDRLEDFFGVYDFEAAFSREAIRDALDQIREDERVRG